MSKIIYLAFYDVDGSDKRQYFESTKSKVDYICGVLKTDYEGIDIISFSYTNKVKSRAVEKNTYFGKLYLMKSYGFNNIIFKMFNYIYICIQCLKKLYTIKKGNDIIIFYHSLYTMWLIPVLKLFLKNKMIFEVEEIYGDVKKCRFLSYLEIKLLKTADGFIVASHGIETLFDSKKPTIVIEGKYELFCSEVKKLCSPIECVYAGTFDIDKGGVYKAISICKFLPSHYTMNIMGFGTKKEIKLVRELIDKSNILSECKIIYHGLKTGDELIYYLSKFDIGLSCQNGLGEYNLTSFPSKVLVYLYNGLGVLSVDIEVVRKSRIGQLVSYYNSNDSDIDIAKKLINMTINHDILDLRRVKSDMDKDLKNFLKEVSDGYRV